MKHLFLLLQILAVTLLSSCHKPVKPDLSNLHKLDSTYLAEDTVLKSKSKVLDFKEVTFKQKSASFDTSIVRAKKASETALQRLNKDTLPIAAKTDVKAIEKSDSLEDSAYVKKIAIQDSIITVQDSLLKNKTLQIHLNLNYADSLHLDLLVALQNDAVLQNKVSILQDKVKRKNRVIEISVGIAIAAVAGLILIH